MPLEADDMLRVELRPSAVSGSGLYDVDTAPVEGDKATESLIYDDDNGILGYKASGSLNCNDDIAILQLSVQGFGLSESGRSCWEDVEIFRAGPRKVAIQFSHIKNRPKDRKKGKSLVIDLDHVLLDPLYILPGQTRLQCKLQVQENAKLYLLGFEAMQDVLKFQEVFTGFSVQTHIPDVHVHLHSLRPKKNSKPTVYQTAIQLWRKVPTQHESLNLTTDATHNPWNAEEGRARSQYESSSPKVDPTSHSPLNPPVISGMAIEAVHSCVAAIVSAYKDGEKIIEQIKARRAARSERAPAPIETLETSLQRGPPAVEQAKDQGSERYGPRYAYSRDRKYKGPSRVQTSNTVLDLPTGSAMETQASSHLVFSGEDILRESHTCSRLSSIPLDGRVPSTSPCWCQKSGSCKHITFGQEIDPTSYWGNFSPRDPVREPRAIEPSATELNASRSLLSLTATPSSLRTKLDTIRQDLKCVELEFRSIEDKMSFKAAYDALRRLAELDGFRRQNRLLLREEKLPSNYQSPREQGSLTRKYESAAVDAENMTSTVAQKGDNTKTTPFYKAKAEKGDSLAPLPRSPPALVGDSSSHTGERPDNLALDGGRLNPKIELDNRKRTSNVSDDRQKESINPSVEGESRQISLLHTLNEYIRSEEDSRITSVLATRSQFPEYSPPEYLEFPAAPAESLLTSERSDISEPHALGPLVHGIFGSPDASFVLETSEDEKHGPRSGTQANIKLQRASIEMSAKREQWLRRVCRRIVVFMLWQREQDVCIPDELWSSPASFEFINVLEMSTFDKIKSLFETYSGREWNWWPFSAPVKPLESGKVRIRWQCACGDQRWTDASKYLARKCQALVNENPTAGHERGNDPSHSAASVASHSPVESVVPGSFPSDGSQSPGDTSNICSTTQASHIQNTYNKSNSKDLYVLFCVYQKSQILHSQILATKCQNDEVFFENLRRENRRLRGFFRFWFSPLQFSHCDFVKFTRFYVNELAKVGHSLPNDLIYEYNPRPPGPHDDPPISPHEFNRRFYTPLNNPCGRSEALERIPKRQKRFQINLHVDGREDMWGLLVELQPCFLVVLMWQIAITGGGWAFMGWWLSRHRGDLQDAAMPITLIFTALMALWAPIGKGMRETL